MVFPAAALPIIASEAGVPIIEVNPEPSGITPLADVFLAGPGGEVLPELLAAVSPYPSRPATSTTTDRSAAE